MSRKNFRVLQGRVQGFQNEPKAPKSRDSGKDFRIPEIGLDNSRFSFILFSYTRVIPSRLSKRPSFLGTDFRFWS